MKGGGFEAYPKFLCIVKSITLPIKFAPSREIQVKLTCGFLIMTSLSFHYINFIIPMGNFLGNRTTLYFNSFVCIIIQNLRSSN